MSKKKISRLGKQQATTWTEKFTVIYGNYQWLNGSPIHYCSTSISIKNLWDDVRLMGEISGVEKWGFEALFQRVVRDEWVNAIKTQYLESSERFKFFPPVTIALLPCESNRPKRNYGENKQFTFEKNTDGEYVAKLAGLEIEFPTSEEEGFPDFGNPALVRWDKTKFSALAIDGQHRISALRKLVTRADQKANQKDVPATFLIFDPDLPMGRDLIQLTREIFIDINKNAKTVDDSRLILLDDRNFYNSLTRRVILQAYPDGETPSTVEFTKIEQSLDLEIPTGIPQELIDTAAGREAADVGKLKDWQFTSAFIINRSLQHFAFENKFKRFEEILETQDFASDSENPVESAVGERREIYENGYDDEDEVISDTDMLSFRPLVTEALVERAMSRHRGLWLGPFTGFSPYRKHIEKFVNAISGEDGDSLRALMLSEASIPGKPSFNTQTALDLQADDVLYKRLTKTLKKLSRPAAWEDSLVWYSVFQRGLLFQPTMLQKAMETARGAGFESRQHFASEYVKSLDLIEAEGYFHKAKKVSGKGLWNGVALKLAITGDLALDGSDGAARRTGLLIRLLCCAIQARDAGGYNHLKNNFTKAGISSAVTAVTNGMSRYFKAVDSIKGTAKDISDYKDPAQKIIYATLKELSENGI